MRLRSLFALSLAVLSLGFAEPRLHAQSGQAVDPGTVTKGAPVEERPDPLKRRLSDHEEAQRRKAVRNELSPEDKKWLNEDVRWIITDEEAQSLQEPLQRRGAAAVHRNVLAAPESESGQPRE